MHLLRFDAKDADAPGWLSPQTACVRSWAYNQSSVRPKQSSLSISALIPGPRQVFHWFVAKELRHEIQLAIAEA